MTVFKNKYIVGLTGGIGSGKTTVANKLSQFGIDAFDVDHIAREVVASGTPCLEAIKSRYGNDILLTDGSLDRRQLRHIIFQNEQEKAWLESLTHPAIHSRLLEYIETSQSPYILLVHPLLFETEKNKICDYTITISIEKKRQLKRVCERDNIDESIANAIIASQLTDKQRRQRSDAIIDNNDNEAELDQKIFTLDQKLRALANDKKQQYN
ncbi:dephospho-CoA kinase [Marinomonas agarivorans]|nr:dephospho-CoA kinase [Marinomonas agarivorans]